MNTDLEMHFLSIGFRVSVGVMTVAALISVFLYFRFEIRGTAVFLMHLRRSHLLRRPAGAGAKKNGKRTGTAKTGTDGVNPGRSEGTEELCFSRDGESLPAVRGSCPPAYSGKASVLFPNESEKHSERGAYYT